MMHGWEKSDLARGAAKPANNDGRPSAELVEQRAGAEGNAGQDRTRRAQDRASVSQGLDRVRHVARQRKKERFTALLHHVTPNRLRTAFFALKRQVAPGVDGLTWQTYEADLDRRIEGLHERVHRLARVQAVVRRSQAPAEAVVQCGDLVVRLDAQRAEIAGQPVPLTGKEYQMLELLALRKGMTISKDMFLSHLYGGMDEPELKIIDVFMCKLRKKLAAVSCGTEYVETVWGRGYMLREPQCFRETG